MRGWVYELLTSKNLLMPKNIARIIRGGWKNRQVRLTTLDGSNQCVHPDVVRFLGELYIAYTPYPYGIDFYENPEIAVLDQYGKWIQLEDDTIAKAGNIEKFYCSDPFLYADDDCLFYFYRITDKEIDPKSSICYTVFDGKKWHSEKILTRKFDQDYISPFILGKVLL